MRREDFISEVSKAKNVPCEKICCRNCVHWGANRGKKLYDGHRSYCRVFREIMPSDGVSFSFQLMEGK